MNFFTQVEKENVYEFIISRDERKNDDEFLSFFHHYPYVTPIDTRWDALLLVLNTIFITSAEVDIRGKLQRNVFGGLLFGIEEAVETNFQSLSTMGLETRIWLLLSSGGLPINQIKKVSVKRFKTGLVLPKKV